MEITIFLNTQRHTILVNPVARLLDILREEFDLISVKEGCGQGECGSCTVLLDGRRVNSCLVPVFQVDGSRIFTIEGIRDWKSFGPIEKAYTEFGAVQCGFCMSGFVISTVSLIHEIHQQSITEELKLGLSGNLCRCTGYTKILETVDFLVKDKSVRKQVADDWRKAFDVS